MNLFSPKDVYRRALFFFLALRARSRALASLASLASLADVFEKNEKKNKTTSVHRLMRKRFGGTPPQNSPSRGFHR